MALLKKLSLAPAKQEYQSNAETADITVAAAQKTEPSEITSTGIPEPSPASIVTAKLPDKQDAQIEWARKKGVPTKALLHASALWLSDDPDDWTAANDTIFQFTSPFGNKQLCYRRSEKVAIPEIGGKHGT